MRALLAAALSDVGLVILVGVVVAAASCVAMGGAP